MYKLFLNIKYTYKILISNKPRFFVTIFGVFLGLIMIFITLEGLRMYYTNEFLKLSKMPKNSVIISSGGSIDMKEYVVKMKEMDYNYSYYSLRKSLDVDTVSYKYKKNTLNCSLNLMGVDYGFEKGVLTYGNDMEYCSFVNVIDGSSFSKKNYEDSLEVAIIEKSTAIVLFGNDDVVGKEISFSVNGEGYQFKIIGIIDDLPDMKTECLKINSAIRFNKDINMEGRIIVPLSWYNQKYVNSDRSYNQVIVNVDEKKYQEEINLVDLIMSSNGKELRAIDYRGKIFELKENIDSMEFFFNILTFLVMIFSGLVVMIVSVFNIKERVKEFGIKRVLGANSRDIILQVAFESVIQSVIAYFLALIFMTISAFFLNLFFMYIICTDLFMTISVRNSIIVFMCAIVEGMIFSVLPTLYALKLKATDALVFT